MKKILFIGIGKKNSSQQRLVATLENKGIEHLYVKWSDLSFLGQRVFASAEEIPFAEIGTVFFDIPRFFVNTIGAGGEKTGFEFVFENELQILLTILKEKNIYAPNCDFLLNYPFYNKFSQSYIFDRNNIPSIPTLHINDNKITKVLPLMEKHAIGFPLVAKESCGGKGDKVWKIKSEAELAAFIENRRKVNIIFQPYIENDADFRVIVIDNKCMGIMKRSAKKGEWKNNFSLGGMVGKHTDPAMEKFAIESCQKMGLDVAGLDIFSTDEGYVIIEANLFFGLDGFESVFTNVDVPADIMNLLIKNNH